MGDESRFQIVRPLGGGRARVIARDTSVRPARLVIVERVAATGVERAQLLRRGRALASLEHPKVVRVREAFESGEDAVFVSDFVDGEWLSAVMAHTPRPPVEVLLRICVDVLEGLAALHDLRDDRGQPMGFVHGGVSPETVLVAEDGVGELARTCAGGSNAKDKYVAPELRRGERPTDLRSDVYSAGAILRDVLAAAPAAAKWAEQLTDVAFRATSVDPQNRWPTAAAMATAVRRIAGAKLATAHDVASSLRDANGSRMRARRAALDMLEQSPASGPPSSEEPISIRGSEMIVIEGSSEPALPLVYGEQMTPTVKTLPPPVPARANVARVTLVKKAVPSQPGLPVDDQSEPEPETTRFPAGSTTQKGITALAPPFPPSPSAKPPPVVLSPFEGGSLPPPDIVPPASLPPPDIQPVSASARSPLQPEDEAYRRKLPTFPTQIEVPRRRSLAVPAMGVATALVLTFGVGWWLGRNHPPPDDTATESISPAPMGTPATSHPATTATVPAPTVAPTASAAQIASSAPSSAPSIAPAAPPPSPAPQPAPVAEVPAVQQPVTQPAPRPAPSAYVAPPAPRPEPTPKPAASPPAPKPTAAPAPPKPSATGGGYTPNEL